VETITTITQKEFKDSPLLSRLLHLYDIPDTIYIRGRLPEIVENERGLLSPRILTIVGSRNHSRYADDIIKYLVSALKGEDVIILSGLALGVDGLAHRAALENNLTTIAIPGSGLSDKVLYPREHGRLATEILYSHGALISELSPDTSAAKWTFPSRNRLMAALSDAVLVVEAREKSGTLITARQALELGKNIGVVPGSIFSDFLKGSHALLQDGAMPITEISHLFDLLSLKKQVSGDGEEKSVAKLDTREKILYELLKEPLSKSELLERSKLTPSEFLIALTNLEMEGFITASLHEVRKVV
jgi:DNA processing protein